jgi:ubiquinone biosynthesis protein COQ9
MTDRMREAMIDAALPHVVFDGWSPGLPKIAAREAGIDPALVPVICPRGVLDLAVGYHRRGDAAMREALAARDLAGMKFRDRVALAVRLRMEAADREVARRGLSFFALPQNAATGASLVWGTADAIWTALGDTSGDMNWYSKRATLSGVHSATVLYWLGDTSPGSAETWAFLDRRIGEVMEFEKLKARLREDRLAGPVLKAMGGLFGAVRKPPSAPADMPGRTEDA